MLNDFFQQDDNTLTFTREQASQFAKGVAGDYNPLHDTDAKRFCVPGDLLFSFVLLNYGISQEMHFSFENMITDASAITLPEAADTLVFADDSKTYVTVTRSDDNDQDTARLESIVKQYVAFSGEAFPHVLVPAMSAKNLMINPKRPMVMYQSMSIHFERTDIKTPILEALPPVFTADGKRGNITLPFIWKDGDEVVGKGEKTMLVSGIVEYDKAAMDALIEKYNESKL